MKSEVVFNLQIKVDDNNLPEIFSYMFFFFLSMHCACALNMFLHYLLGLTKNDHEMYIFDQ